MNKTPNPDDSMGLADASLWRRLAAGLYDLFLLFAVLFFFSFVLLKVMGGAEPGVDGLYLDNQGEDLVITSDEQFRPPLSGPWFDLGLYCCCLMFYLLFWTTKQSTLGMQTWKLKLVDLRGNKPPLGRMILRFLAGTVSLCLFGLGFLYSLIDRQNRTWHDLISGTRVIVKTDNA